jgi:superfamily II DNA/RNA helicase
MVQSTNKTQINAYFFFAAINANFSLSQRAQGSGKTLAYLLPVLAHLARLPGSGGSSVRRLRALIVVPTRDLAVQVGAVASAVAALLGIEVL